MLIYSSAGDYPPASTSPPASADFQKPYMHQWLRFIEIDVLDEIVVAPTLTEPPQLAAIKAACRHQARAVAQAL